VLSFFIIVIVILIVLGLRPSGKESAIRIRSKITITRFCNLF